jgi:NAD/NADP transhydrogenase alpha subunit
VSETTIGVPKETYTNERRVAVSPEATQRLTKLGFKVNVESGAGAESEMSDALFKDAGANIVSKQDALQSDLVLKVRAPNEEELSAMKDESALISFLYPAQNPELVDKLN